MRQAIEARAAGALLFAFCAALAGSVLAEQIPTPAPTPKTPDRRRRFNARSSSR